MQASELSSVLQASIAPVTLISGVGLLLLSMTNRLGRAIDRARILSAEAKHDGPAATTARIQIDIIHRRAMDLQRAVIFAVLSIFCVAVLILLLFGKNALGLGVDGAVIVFFGASLASLVVSLLFFLRDISLSLKALKLEIGSQS